MLAAGLLAGCASSGVTLPPVEDPAERALAQRGDTWLVLGKRLLAAGEHDLAMEAFERSLVAEGPSAQAMTGAGLAAEAQGLLTMAARYFEKARDLAPDSVVAHNNLGVVLFRLGEPYQARQAFQAAFALSDGASPMALQNLRLSEEVIAEREAALAVVDPATNFRVDRRGSSEFKLSALKPAEERQIVIEAVAAEPVVPERIAPDPVGAVRAVPHPVEPEPVEAGP
ncbi:MAG TPA: tetratricopeptide repeat protein [Thermohalobaculum sp.]|nr:tetratricopeptide repeat protein [Thermohalobaculum sp.]